MLYTPAGGTRSPITTDELEARNNYLAMRGGDVYRNAVGRMSEAARSVLERSDLTVDDVDLFVGHQANVRIINAVGKRLDMPSERIHVTVDKHANTSAASVPLALADARDAGRLSPGDTVLLAGFGAGFTWGACLMTWQPTVGVQA